MKGIILVLFALITVAICAQVGTKPKNVQNAHNRNPPKAGECPPLMNPWNLGPRPLTKKNVSKDDKPSSLHGLFPSVFFPGPWSFPTYPQQPPLYPPFGGFYPPVGGPYPQGGMLFPQGGMPYPPRFPQNGGFYPSKNMCVTDSDCDGVKKCCGRRCTPPIKYDSICGFVPTDNYCQEVCEKKKICLTSASRDCRDYTTYCRSYCTSNDNCQSKRCCRNMRCSFTCA